jgi:peptide deformylase
MLPIITQPNDILRKKSSNIGLDLLIEKEIQTLIDDMIPTMYGDDGIGLAAPQIGKNIQLCIIGKQAFGKKIKVHKGEIPFKTDLVLVNPRFEPMSSKKIVDVEGCLSVPNTFGKVRRFKNILVIAIDREGKTLEFEANNFFARVIQHEIDHLNGILFTDKAKDIFVEEKNNTEI